MIEVEFWLRLIWLNQSSIECESGIFSIDDDSLFRFLHKLYTTENIRIEPSAAAGFAGPFYLCLSTGGQKWLADNRLADRLENATHIIWTTGGCLVPPAEFIAMTERGSRAGLAFPG